MDEILRDHFGEIDLAGFGLEIDALQAEHDTREPAEPAPEMPIVAKFSEKYSAFVIVVNNEIDENHIAELLGVDQSRCYKSSRIGRTNVLDASQFIQAWKSAKS